MDREVLLALLAFAILGPAVLVAGAWPQRHERASSARQWERATWRAVWMPVVPAAVALSMLLGWAAMEPDNAEPLPAPIIGLSALFAIGWMRALIRSGKAARRRRSHIAAGTVGFWRPRIIVATDFVARLDADEVHAVSRTRRRMFDTGTRFGFGSPNSSPTCSGPGLVRSGVSMSGGASWSWLATRRRGTRA